MITKRRLLSQSSRVAPIADAKSHVGGSLIMGKLSSNNISLNSFARTFVAAKPLIKKAICIHNVDESVAAGDLRACLSVNVVSCFETKPRRRRYGSATSDSDN